MSKLLYCYPLISKAIDLRINDSLYFARLIILLSLFLTPSPTTMAAQAEFTWYKLDFPPYTIKDGIYKNNGLGDRIQHFVSTRLPEYRHRTVFVTASRLYNDLQNGKNVCTVNSNYDVVSDNRRGISLPTNIYYNYNLVTRLDNKHKSTNEVSLNSTISEEPKRMLLDAGRPYQHLDALLKPFIAEGNIQLRNGESLSAAILHMIDRGRADYTLELCSTVRYLSATEKFQHQFMCYEIKENPTPFGRAAITCSRNEWGDTAVDKINQILIRNRGRKEYMEMMQQWYVPSNKEQQKRYWQEYQQSILAELPKN